MLIPGMAMEMRGQIAMLLASDDGPNTVTAKLLWREVDGLPQDYDRNDESGVETGVVSSGEMEFRAFFHQVDHRLSGFQQFKEVQTGDVILDYLADLQLEGRKDVRVMVGGAIYVQKNASTKLLESWDVLSDYGGLMKSILLTPGA